MKASVKKGGRLTAVLLVSAVGLVACGSDNDNDRSPTPPVADNSVPASAGGSVAAYIAYLRGLTSDETSAPASVGSFVAPVDDTAAGTSLGS
ncbi:MAG TPA: hypothetical protein VEY69_08205 [Lautropia sp.]|nr:hypothetical protein [Lautropia sp.]